MTERPAGAAPLDVTLSHPKAERVKQVRALAGRSARSRAGQLLVEGPQGVREVVRWTPDRIRDLYLTEPAAVRHPEILAAARAAKVRIHGATEDVVSAMSGDAQGMLAVATQWRDHPSSVWTAAPNLVAVLSNVRDPGNAGTAIRVADAAGAGAVFLVGDSVDVFNPKVVRATAGSLFHLPVITGVMLGEVAGQARSVGMQVWAADAMAGTALDSPEVRTVLNRPTAWVFGNEAWGLTPEDIALCDQSVSIPIHGKAESLNLATAVSVCLFASALAGGAS